MKKHLWFETWLTKHIVLYGGTLGLHNFKIGLTVGTENNICLGFICLGIDWM